MRLFHVLSTIVWFVNFPGIFSQIPYDDHGQSPLDPKTDKSFVRLVFSNGSEYYYRHWECPDGVWAEEAFQNDPPTCACVKGAFLVSKGLCDEEFEILTGNEHCYDISGSMIRKFTPLTGEGGLSGRANTVFRRDAPYVARLISPTPVQFVQEPVHYLFRLNDPHDFSVYASLPDGTAAKLSCFPAQAAAKNSTSALIQIAKLPNCATEFRGPKQWCGEDIDYGEYVTTIAVGSKWGPQSSGSGTLYPGSCAKSGGGSGKGGGGGSKGKGKGGKKKGGTGPGRRKRASKHSEPTCDEFDAKVIEEPVQDQTPQVEYFIDRKELNPDHEFHTTSMHQTEVNEQTKRVVDQILGIHVINTDKLKKSSRLHIEKHYPPYRIVQVARLIMEKVCPQEQVSSFLLNFINELFRLIYLDVSQEFPYPEDLPLHSTTNTEILTTLGTCLGTVPNITMIPNDTCKDAGMIGANLTDSRAYFYGQNLTLPNDVKFDLSTVDIPLETMWKVMLLVHYSCASNFSNPYYHSQFAVKFEAFFRNPIILYRWYHSGPSNDILRMLLSGYNLKQFAESIDRCVAVSNAMSDYKGWLRRPADNLKWKRKHTTKTTIRKKRYYFQNNFWDEKAYCLRNSKGIVSEVHSSSVIDCRTRPLWFQNTD